MSRKLISNTLHLLETGSINEKRLIVSQQGCLESYWKNDFNDQHSKGTVLVNTRGEANTKWINSTVKVLKEMFGKTSVKLKKSKEIDVSFALAGPYVNGITYIDTYNWFETGDLTYLDEESGEWKPVLPKTILHLDPSGTKVIAGKIDGPVNEKVITRSISRTNNFKDISGSKIKIHGWQKLELNLANGREYTIATMLIRYYEGNDMKPNNIGSNHPMKPLLIKANAIYKKHGSNYDSFLKVIMLKEHLRLHRYWRLGPSNLGNVISGIRALNINDENRCLFMPATAADFKESLDITVQKYHSSYNASLRNLPDFVSNSAQMIARENEGLLSLIPGVTYKKVYLTN